MHRIAIAGGLGDVGRAIAEELTRQKDCFVYVLTRKLLQNTEDGLENYPEICEVNYSSQEAIHKLLTQLNVDTVISTLNLHWPGAADSQINLIRAAANCKTVTRFIPSEFNVDYNVPEEDMPYPPRIKYIEAAEELRQHPSLKYTFIRNGFFMDYLGLPYAETTLKPLHFLIDLRHKLAVIPGDGTQHVVFTHTKDVGKYVAALIQAPAEKWPIDSAIIGERITLNELVKIVEKVTGEKFTLFYDSIEDLRRGVTTELPSNSEFYKYFPNGKEELNNLICTHTIGMGTGVFDIPGTPLNSLFPEIKSTPLEEFLLSSWKKGQQEQVDVRA